MEYEIQETIDYTMTKAACKFHKSEKFVRLQVGPVGCGKSSDSCLDIMIRAQQQAAADDGIRYSRWAVIRNTYPELKSTTIKTWLDWFPERIFGKVKWSSPITHHIRIGDIDLEVIFLPLDSEQDVKKLMSLELTGVYINELQFVHKKVFKISQQRVNRFPSKKSGSEITWTGVIADTNPPDNDHWIYQIFEEERPANYECVRFAPALVKVDHAPNDVASATSLNGTIYINNPIADYINNLPDKNYYLNQVPSSTDDEIKVYFLGDYGVVMDGKAVHPAYSDRYHFSNKVIGYNKQIELGLGWDFGLTPACAIVQLTARGQFVVLDELYSEDMGLRDFAENVVIPHLDTHYEGWRDNYASRHDPAGQTGAQTDKKTCQMILNELGITSLPAATSNAPTARRDGLDYFLRRLVDGEPGFLLSSLAKFIRKGLMGGYQYARIKAGGEDRYHEVPLKNMYSHVCEGLEYIAMKYARIIKQPATDEKEKPYRIHRGSFMSM
jgi:hypothetical protein